MSSSPTSLLPPLASSEPFPPASSSIHGTSARVSHLPGVLQALQIEESGSSDRVAAGGGGSSADVAEARRPALNPFAQEFVPGSAASSPNEGFCARADPEEVVLSQCEPFDFESSRQPEIGSESINVAPIEGNLYEGVDPLHSNTLQRSGGLSTAFRRGQAGQSRTLVASTRAGQTRHGGSDGTSHQTVTGTAAMGKRGQFSNANHLLNFQYDPIPRPPPRRTSLARRPQRTQPYDKELFLQANFRFLVSDFGDYMLNTSDPDKMLQWEDIAAVNVSAPVPIQCPICLENPPLCPQITSCGHIFCFPCILRYLVMGEEDQKGDYFKKCPLCFAMISCKNLRTVFIDYVHNYQVGECVEFSLLNRAKGSIIPIEKSDPVLGSLPYSKDGQCHPFSKFTLTSDAEHTANKAIAELSTWADRSQKERGEDLDLLPYVFAAIDQLQQRTTAWGEHRVSEFLSSSPPVRQRIMAQTKEGPMNFPTHGSGGPDTDALVTEAAKSSAQKRQEVEKVNIAAETEAAMAELKDRAGWVYESAFSDEEDGSASWKHGPRSTRLKGGAFQAQVHRAVPQDRKMSVKTADVSSTWENLLEETQSVNTSESISDLDKQQQDLKKDLEDKESYAFYQSADGQPLILHPLNMKCLLQHYGTYDNLPSRLQGKIMEMETLIQTEATRKRYRYLSHLPLTTNFQFCEVDLRGTLPSTAFALFIEEIRIRENRRRRRLKQEQEERAKEERIATTKGRYSPSSDFVASLADVYKEELPSSLDFEESLGEPSTTSGSPVLDQRKLFSQVTKLGFASAHDAPNLIPAKSGDSSSSETPAALHFMNDSGDTMASRASPMSFVDIIQAQPSKSVQNGSSGSSAATQSTSKKGRKAAKVLLSTAGGRRY